MLALLFFRGGGGLTPMPPSDSGVSQGNTTGSATGKRRRPRIAGAKATHFSLDTGTVYGQRAFGKATSESGIQSEAQTLLTAEQAAAEEADAVEAMTVFMEMMDQ